MTEYLDFEYNNRMYSVREGDFSELINKYRRRVYTHHPVAILNRLIQSRQFSHLSVEELVTLCQTRYTFCEWGRRTMGEFGNLSGYPFDDETEYKLALYGGCTCIFCGDLIWAPICIGSYYDLPKMFQKKIDKLIKERKKEAEGNNQFNRFFSSRLNDFISCLFNGICYAPIACHSCLSIASRHMPHDMPWKMSEPYALQGVLNLMLHEAEKKFGSKLKNPFRKPQKRIKKYA